MIADEIASEIETGRHR